MPAVRWGWGGLLIWGAVELENAETEKGLIKREKIKLCSFLSFISTGVVF
jgi:hypothetical protein